MFVDKALSVKVVVTLIDGVNVTVSVEVGIRLGIAVRVAALGGMIVEMIENMTL